MIELWVSVCCVDYLSAYSLLQDLQKVPVSSEPETSVQPCQEWTHAGVRWSLCVQTGKHHLKDRFTVFKTIVWCPCEPWSEVFLWCYYFCDVMGNWIYSPHTVQKYISKLHFWVTQIKWVFSKVIAFVLLQQLTTETQRGDFVPQIL